LPTRPPPYARIGDLPIIPQKFNNCGPTNLTIVLNHFGVAVDQFDVAGVVRPNYEDRNVSPGELVGYVNDHTPLRAAAYAGGDLETLRRLLRAGFPVIIEKGLEPDEATGWMGHYLTVAGYDDVTGHFLVRDTFLGPWRGDGLASYDATERYWGQFNNTFIVVYPAERTADVAAALGPQFADPATMWAAAAERAREAARLQPDNAFAWFNLGSSLTELAELGGDDHNLYTAAAAAYDQARLLGLPPRMIWYQFGPYEAYLASGRYDDVLALTGATLENQGGRNVEETYYFHGLALAATGDGVGAQAAFTRAGELNPALAEQ
jgi:tetratricopeptide (TPR) repeat protein